MESNSPWLNASSQSACPWSTAARSRPSCPISATRGTCAELLDHLKALYAECGRLSGFIIDQAPALPSAATYIQRFGSLTRAYELVGYHCPRSTEFLEINRRLRQLHPEIVSRTEHTWKVLSAEWRVLSQASLRFL